MSKKNVVTTYIHKKNETIAMEKYQGKTYKAKAKCDPNDVYDENIGERLATVRVKKKVALARSQRLAKKLAYAYVEDMYWQHEKEMIGEALENAIADEKKYNAEELKILEEVSK